MSQTKTYVLLDHTLATAQVYQQVNAQQRVRLDKRQVDHAHGQITFTDRDGKNKTLRLKLQTDEIDQAKQIKEIGIPANEKYTQSERDALMFRNGVLITDNPTVQKFLEESPQYEDNWLPEKDPEGKKRVVRTQDVRQPLYKLFDKTIELKTDDEMFVKRVKAANKIMETKDIQAGQNLLYRLFGAFHKAPDNILEIRAQLIEYLDESDEKMLDNILKEDKEMNIDEGAEILIGKAIGLKIISFDTVPNQIVMTVGGKQRNVKQIPSEFSPEERKLYFAQFLTSEDGKLVRTELEKEVKAKEPKVKEPAAV